MGQLGFYVLLGFRVSQFLSFRFNFYSLLDTCLIDVSIRMTP